MTAPRCVATKKRIRWALLRSGVSKAEREAWLSFDLTMDDARCIADLADVPLAALFAADPPRRSMLGAWLSGLRRKHS